MNEQLVNVLAERRQQAGNGSRPLGFKQFGCNLGVEYTTLFRFFKGTKSLGIDTVRVLAKGAVKRGDGELLQALARYALDVEIVLPVAAESNQ